MYIKLIYVFEDRNNIHSKLGSFPRLCYWTS